jgi:SAM-dependent methyltransferase
MGFKNEIASFLQDFVDAAPAKGAVLDVGCGGRIYEDIFKKHSYTGIDVQESGRDNKKPDKYYDGKYIPFPDASFETVISTEVFEHVEDLDHLIKDIFRVTKPNGHLIVTVPFIWGEHEMPYDFRRFTSIGIRNYLKQNGFELVKERKGTVGVSAFVNLGSAEIYASLKNRSFTAKLKAKIAILFLKVTGKMFRLLGINMPRIYIRNIVLARKTN